MTNVKWSFLGNLVLTQKNHFFGCMIWASKREQTSKDHITPKLIFSVSIPGVPEDPFHTILYRIFWRLKWEVSPTYFQIIKLFYKALYYYFFQYKGFPKKFTTRKDLMTFLNRFIWLTVQHAACNYPLIPYGAYVPIAPAKLY